MNEFKISPSILSANFAQLGEEVRAVDAAGADYIHVDVMDGHFVPNLTIGSAVVRDIRSYTEKPFDVHLMIEPAAPFLRDFAEAGADIITVHVEADTHLQRNLQVIRDLGCKAGVSLNPSTSPTAIECVLENVDLILIMSVNPGFGGQTFIKSQIEKIQIIRGMIGDRDINLEVDGGVNVSNVASIVRAGADIIVAGSAIFGDGDYRESIRALRDAINH